MRLHPALIQETRRKLFKLGPNCNVSFYIAVIDSLLLLNASFMYDIKLVLYVIGL